MDTKRKRSPGSLSAFTNGIQRERRGEIGCCGALFKVNYLTQRGKKTQLARMLCLIFIPLSGVWGFCISSLYDNIQAKTDFETAKYSMRIVIRMGRLIHKLQKERDMTILYVGKLGPGTKSFLLKNYEETDEAFANMDVWPTGFEKHPEKEFRTRENLMIYISQHRKHLDPATTNTIREIQFYTDIANRFMIWMLENIRDAGFGAFWKSLVAYQKLTRCSLDAGAERAYGVMFYTNGGFFAWEDFELYNTRVHSFKIHYQAAVQYSPLVNPLLDDDASEINATRAINGFREEIRNAKVSDNKTYQSFEKAGWLFDNMTIRIDCLFSLQEQIAETILRMLDKTISDIVVQIAISGVLVFLAIGICPVIVSASDSLTSSIAAYSQILMEKSSELDEEKNKSDTILYQLIPKSVAERLKNDSNVGCEFFRSVTLMFSSIVDFTRLTMKFSPMELVEMLNYLYSYFDDRIESYDVYKVETINDTYMLASGLPNPNGDRHASEIAHFAVDVLRMMHNSGFTHVMHGQQLQLRIGISTGSVSAGIIGTAMLRYCVFGDTVNTASRMMSCGEPNMIHISETTYKKLRKTGNFKMETRGTIDVKGKGQLATFWLLDSLKASKGSQAWPVPGQIRGRISLVSATDTASETRYEPEPSSSTPQPVRRMSYSAMHVTG